MTKPAGTSDATGEDRVPMWRRVVGAWRTLIVVTLVAVLIWLFAEGQSLTRAGQAVRIDFVDETGERVVRIASEGWTGTVQVNFEGAASAVDQAKTWLSEGIDIPLGIDGVPAAEGTQTVDLRVALRNLDEIENAGLRVTDVEPATVRLEIEALVALEDVPVAPELAGIQVTGGVEAAPAAVRVRGPRTVIEQLQALPGGARVVARLSESVVRDLPDGVQVAREAGLRLPGELNGGRNVRIRPEKTTLTFTVRSRTASTTVSAPVWVLLPPFEMDRWDVEVAEEDQLLRNLRVTGPGDVIRQIEAGEIPVIAAVSLSSDELDRGVTSKAPQFWQLPSGVTVEGLEGPVRFTIERRSAAGASGGSE